jgi:2-dehydropantoate 2-reductase
VVEKMKIVIMGAGAIGSLYGGLLSLKGGHEVILVGRQHHVTAIKSHGLRIKGVLGDHTIYLDATTEPCDIQDVDYIFLTTKTYDTANAAECIHPLVENGAYVILLQNGIGTEQIAADVLGSRRILRATTCMGSIITGDGEVTCTGEGITEIGSHFPENKDIVEAVAAMLEGVGLETHACNNIESVVWTKAIVNCGINPIAALTGLTNGEVYADMHLRKLIVNLVTETSQVAHALGINLTTDNPIRYVLGTAKATGANINSMLQDIKSHKRTEIESITGYVVKCARELGIKTPFSDAIYGLIKALESRQMREVSGRTEDSTLTSEELLKALSMS